MHLKGRSFFVRLSLLFLTFNRSLIKTIVPRVTSPHIPKMVPLSIYLYYFHFVHILPTLVFYMLVPLFHRMLHDLFTGVCVCVCAHRRCVMCLWHRLPNLELNLIYCEFAEQKTNEDIFCTKAQKVQIICWIWCEARVIQIFQPLAMRWHVVPLTKTMRCRAEWCTQASIVSISRKTNDDEQRTHLID